MTEGIEKILECPICLEQIKNPKMLPCQHSFCLKNCLQNLVDDFAFNQVMCPMCRGVYDVPLNGVFGFPNNYILQSLLEKQLEINESKNFNSNQAPLLVIEPQHKLKFVGPFTTPVATVMTLKNPSDRKICFKIKTSAPKCYYVKPNVGLIGAGKEVQIAVILQPFEYDTKEKNHHKFMVQSMFAPEYMDPNPDRYALRYSVWKNTDGNQVMDSMLKCVSVMPNNIPECLTQFGNFIFAFIIILILLHYF